MSFIIDVKGGLHPPRGGESLRTERDGELYEGCFMRAGFV